VIAHALLVLALQGREPVPGVYPTGKAGIYVGIEAEPADSRTIQYFDPQTRRLGTLRPTSGGSFETTDRPVVTYTLAVPSIPVEEQPFTVRRHGRRSGSLALACSIRCEATNHRSRPRCR